MRLHQKDRSYENWAFNCKIYNFILNQSNAEVFTIQESVKPTQNNSLTQRKQHIPSNEWLHKMLQHIL